ncbi:MAG: porin family protein [Muribaculaceae bacterium]|nr:porin family protein [Muribaculaceae bacterium]
MKSIRKILIIVALTLVSAMPAMAQFSWGPKVGVAVNNLHFNKDIANEIISNDNRAGFTGGLTAELMFPVLNLGFDASVMYVHRSSELDIKNIGSKTYADRDYIDIPINLKWKIGLPIVGNIISPYLFTGPSFSFLVSDTNTILKNKSFDVAWNLGVGLQLFRKLQVGASYGWGITKATTGLEEKVEGKNRYWTITAAYLF